jgi:hypothetical protein
MARLISTGKTTHSSEVRFWALFAVVLALFTQVLFPPQVMAMPSEHGVQMVLCTSGMDSQPIVDKITVKSPVKKPGLAGLKCAQCVLASVTAITTPQPVFQPTVYTIAHADFTPATRRSPVKARAPLRPHSCGPPSQA